MNQIKKLTKDSNFFEPAKFKPFHQDIKYFRIPIQPKAIQQLNLKCYGYGYFEEEGNNIQTQLKQNFLDYLQAALNECTGLRILKIQFNNFSIKEDRVLIKIISLIELLIERKDIEVLWFHTRLLRDCQTQRISEILSMTDRLILKNKVQQISLQFSAWEFFGEPPSYQELLDRFKNFAFNLMEQGVQNLKRFKLDLSSLYVSDLEGYNFLKGAIQPRNLLERVQNAKFSQEKKANPVPESKLGQLRDQIRHYLKNIDQIYEIEHPIPGKTKFISRQPEFQKRKKEYIYEMLKNNISKEDLLKVYNQQRGMPQIHKVALKRIKQEVDQEMEVQSKRIKEGKQLIQQNKYLQKSISESFVKFPFDFIMSERVLEFHRLIKLFVQELHSKLSKMQQFELDMRNWNPIFQMGDLKKMLLKQISQGGVKPNLNSTSKIIPKNEIQQAEEGTKFRCRFIM